MKKITKLSKVNITTYDFISNVFALKQVVRRRMYDTYGKSAMLPEIIWNYLAWPVSDSPVRITETTAIGWVIEMFAMTFNNFSFLKLQFFLQV